MGQEKMLDLCICFFIQPIQYVVLDEIHILLVI